jgi:serine protease Do
MKIKLRWLLLPALLLSTLFGLAQGGRPGTLIRQNLSENISAAIKLSYRASVLMWELDSLKHERRSAQFSGVVVTADGIILSAAHVVMPGKTYKVMFPNGMECIASGLSRIALPPSFTSPDVAMLKIIDKGSWPYVKMGWSSSLKIGQPCISIAYPESLELRQPTVRVGSIKLLKNTYGFIQSSCVMEPGDSGGPLFDIFGRVIGIHSGIEKSEEVNYEIPIDLYRKYWTALKLAINYNTLPADTDRVEKPPFNHSTVPRLAAAAGNRTSSKCVLVQSTLNGIDQHISGTVFSFKWVHVKPAYADKSIIISKSSMVGEDPVIQFANNRTCNAVILKRDKKNDLVILAAVEDIGEGIAYTTLNTDTVTFKDLGKVMISAIPNSPGITGYLGSTPFNLPKRSSYGYLGAAIKFQDGKITFSVVQTNSAADYAGIKTEDELVAIAEHPITVPDDFPRELFPYMAGDTISVTVNRAGQSLKKEVVLKYPPQRISDHPADNFEGGKSIRRDGFDHVFVHDARLKPYQCGGPVLDEYGRFYGINISRQSRTSCIVLPVATIEQLLASVLLMPKKGKQKEYYVN